MHQTTLKGKERESWGGEREICQITQRGDEFKRGIKHLLYSKSIEGCKVVV